MADAGTGFERNMDDSPGYSPFAGGNRGPADRMPRPVPPPDPMANQQSELNSLLRLGTQKQEAGDDTQAEEILRKALEIADRTLGPDHPDLMLLLTDLTRLYLRRSAFAAVEPLLLRLLELKRGKGEDHPEVATVLASLANVRQALGRHESAEQLWRRVLEIRERTLAPNHFAIATALERLGDTCAARGKIEEALSTFQRALAIRERTLGGEHPSLRLSRERIADLQLQASSEDSLDPGTGAESSTHERLRLISSESVALKTLAPAPREKVSTPRKPSVVVRGAFVEQAPAADPPPMPLVAAKNEDGSPLFEAGAPATASFSERPTFLDTLEDLREELEREDDAGGFAERTAQLLTAALAFVKAQPVIVGGAVVLMSLLLVAIVGGPHAFGESDQGTAFVSSSAESPAVTAPVVPTSIVTSSEANPPAPGGAGPSVKAVPTRPRLVEERPVPSKKTPEKKAETKFAIPTLSTAALSRLDSAASKAGSVSTRVGDPVLTAPPNPLTTGRSTFGDNDQSGAPVRARLIGDLPTPRVPNQVTDVEGEVRVRFNVDTNGRPVMATFVVVNSPNPLLTEAVRKVIPGMRFEPARTGGPDSKPIVDVMQIGFQFSRQE